MQGIRGDRPIHVTGVCGNHTPLLAALLGTARRAPRIRVRALDLVVPHVGAEFEILRAAPVAVDAGEDCGVGEGLEGVVTDGGRGWAVGGDATVADALAVRFHVDWGAGEVALAEGAFQVLEDVVGDVFAADFWNGNSITGVNLSVGGKGM